MTEIKITKMCGCVKKAKMSEVQEFQSKEEALKKANEMVVIMNQDFCQRHNFKVIEEGETILIKVEDN
jgi:predicted nucleotidyltransferase